MVVVAPESEVVDNKVMPPPAAGADQAGTPPTTVRTSSVEPIPNLAGVDQLEE